MAKARAILAADRALLPPKPRTMRPSRGFLAALALLAIALLVTPLLLRSSVTRAPVSQESEMVLLWASSIDSRGSSSGSSPLDVVVGSNMSSLLEIYATSSGDRPSLDKLTGNDSSLTISPVFENASSSLTVTRLADGQLLFSFRPGSEYCLSLSGDINGSSTVTPGSCS